MTSPIEQIQVECPHCAATFEDWYRGSVNLDLEGWDPNDPEVVAYLRDCSIAKCPACSFVVELETLTISNGVWRL